jgi:hypothetical protein
MTVIHDHAMKSYTGLEVQLCTLLTKWLTSNRHWRLYWGGWRTAIHWIWDWMGPTAGMQTPGRRYTNWAVPGDNYLNLKSLNKYLRTSECCLSWTGLLFTEIFPFLNWILFVCEGCQQLSYCLEYLFVYDTLSQVTWYLAELFFMFYLHFLYKK